MDEEKKKYRVEIFTFIEGQEEDETHIYAQTFDYLDVKDVVKRLNGGY